MLRQLIFQGLTTRVQLRDPGQEHPSTAQTENHWANQDTILAFIMEISTFMEQRDGGNFDWVLLLDCALVHCSGELAQPPSTGLWTLLSRKRSKKNVQTTANEEESNEVE
eukprot:2504366-Amphidinium_carterae.2